MLYIGSAVNLSKRWPNHLSDLKINKHGNSKLQHAYNKYGKNNFEFRVLRVVEDKKDLVKIEQFYLDMYKPYYNICKTAGSCLGIRRTEKAKKNMSNARKGMKLSEEHKRKIGEALKGEKHPMFGKHHSKEASLKMSLSRKGKKLNKEHCISLSKAHKGIKFSKEHKRKLREKAIGRKLSEETKIKIGMTLRKRFSLIKGINSIEETKKV